MKADHSILKLCANLQVSPSGYYDWEQQQVTPGAHAGRCGAGHGGGGPSPAKSPDLRPSAHRGDAPRPGPVPWPSPHCPPDAVQGPARPPEGPATASAPPTATTTTPSTPNQIWVADITYIPTQAGWLYLAAILDRYSRKIVGWAMGATLGATLVFQVLAMAVLHRDARIWTSFLISLPNFIPVVVAARDFQGHDTIPL